MRNTPSQQGAPATEALVIFFFFFSSRKKERHTSFVGRYVMLHHPGTGLFVTFFKVTHHLEILREMTSRKVRLNLDSLARERVTTDAFFFPPPIDTHPHHWMISRLRHQDDFKDDWFSPLNRKFLYYKRTCFAALSSSRPSPMTT